MHTPLTRVVKLTLDPLYINSFKSIFLSHQSGISQMRGCISLQAFQDPKEPHIFFTISQWENEQALDNYRYSDFFKALWAKVKPMFTDRAMAHSLSPVM